MRVGKVVTIYDSIVPIPRTLAISFGLEQESQLHIAPTRSAGHNTRPDPSLIVSPVPVTSWASVCRLSVRLFDRPSALATATRFLVDRRINILLTEACSTYKGRAHWDAICDLQHCPDFLKLRSLSLPDRAKEYAELLYGELLPKLSGDLHKYVEEHPDVFLQDEDRHADFSPLTGLNNAAASVCDMSSHELVTFRDGAVDLPRRLFEMLKQRLDSDAVSGAVVTGNTEQRYLRIELISAAKASRMFQASIINDIPPMPGDGLGVLHGLLASLPKAINVTRVSNYVTARHEKNERGRIELLGEWRGDGSADTNRRRLQSIVRSVRFSDTDGVEHSDSLTVDSFVPLVEAFPKVFVAYPSGDEAAWEKVRLALQDNDFAPVQGSGPGPSTAGRSVDQRVLDRIRKCVAFVGVWSKNERYRSPDGEYFSSPWMAAEEMYAHARKIKVYRLIQDGVTHPGYRHLDTETFSDRQSLDLALRNTISALRRFRASPEFVKAIRKTRRAFVKRPY